MSDDQYSRRIGHSGGFGPPLPKQASGSSRVPDWNTQTAACQIVPREAMEGPQTPARLDTGMQDPIQQQQFRVDGSRPTHNTYPLNDDDTPGAYRNNKKRGPRDSHMGWGNPPPPGGPELPYGRGAPGPIASGAGWAAGADQGRAAHHDPRITGGATGVAVPPLPHFTTWGYPVGVGASGVQTGMSVRAAPPLPSPPSGARTEGGILPIPLVPGRNSGLGWDADAAPGRDSAGGWGYEYVMQRDGYQHESGRGQNVGGHAEKTVYQTSDAAGQGGGGQASGWGDVAVPQTAYGGHGSGWGQEGGGWGNDPGAGWGETATLPKGAPPDDPLWTSIAHLAPPAGVDGWNTPLPPGPFTLEERIAMWENSAGVEALFAYGRGQPIVGSHLESPPVVWPERGARDGRGAELLDSAERMGWKTEREGWKPYGSGKRSQKERGRAADVQPMPLGWSTEDVKYCHPMEKSVKMGC